MRRGNRVDFAGSWGWVRLGTGGINWDGEGKILIEITGIGRRFSGKGKT